MVIALGSFTANYNSSRQLTVAGKASAVWKNGRRLNPTRWEAIGASDRTALLALIGPVFAFIFWQVVDKLKSDYSFSSIPSLKNK